jgi:hypothetical protein
MQSSSYSSQPDGPHKGGRRIHIYIYIYIYIYILFVFIPQTNLSDISVGVLTILYKGP